MNIDLGSFAFGSSLESGGGTPSWGTALGQSSPDYKFSYPGCEAILIGMVYCSVPLDNVRLPIGKGGRVYVASNRNECQLASLFQKVFINGIKIDYPFIMVLMKEESDSHPGRKGIKYSDKIEYEDDTYHYSNQEFINRARLTLNMDEGACWFVYKIEVENQDELHLFAVIVDSEDNVVYENSSKRRNSWLKLIPDIENEPKVFSSDASFEDNTTLQQIFYGAPGTGKSHCIKELTAKAEKDGRVIRTTFHPDSDYSTFVGCYKPTMKRPEKVYSESELKAKLKEIKESGVTYPCHKFATKYWKSLKDLSVEVIKNILLACGFTESMNVEISKGIALGQEFLNTAEDGKIIYGFTPQAFTSAYIKAWNTTENIYLIIEEINRGNCAQIFGDLFQLLDRKNGESEYPIDADNDLAAFIAEKLANSSRIDIPDDIREGKKLKLPANLYIWATMNTSDQSLFPIDSAFKRRWEWKYMPINNHEDKGYQIEIGGVKYDWWGFLARINHVINDTTNSEDKKLGYFFAKAKGKTIDAEQFVGKVLFYLWNDVFKSYGFDDPIFSKGDNKKFEFSDFFMNDGNPNTDTVNLFLRKLEETIKMEGLPLEIIIDKQNETQPDSEPQEDEA